MSTHSSFALVLHADTPAGKAALAAAAARGLRTIAVRMPSGAKPKSDTKYITINTSEVVAIEKLARLLDSQRKRIDVLITCPATVTLQSVPAFSQPFEKVSQDDWDSVIERDLRSAMLFCRIFGARMRRRRRGRIVQLVSNVAIDPYNPRLFSGVRVADAPLYASAAYTCAMGGLLALSRFLAAHYQDSGVLINNVVFGPLQGAEVSEFSEAYVNRVPLGRIMTEADLANALDVLLNPETTYITGQNIIVDGGVTIW